MAILELIGVVCVEGSTSIGRVRMYAVSSPSDGEFKEVDVVRVCDVVEPLQVLCTVAAEGVMTSRR